MKIIFSGGGTLGSVSPLIAVYLSLIKQNPGLKCLFVGSRLGPEQAAVASYRLPFRAIRSGRLRRFWDWRNLLDPFNVLAGFLQSLWILATFRPRAVVVAGSFVGVPVAWAACVLRIPVIIHQQDIIPGLANRLMANCARRITVSFDISLKDFSPRKTVLTGNAIRPEFFACQMQESRGLVRARPDLPLVVICGGGTGAQRLNELVAEAAPELSKFCQVLHITGKGKRVEVIADNYHQEEFLTTEMPDAFCAADLVVSRAGLSTLSELAALGKPTIIIPIADSHQEANAHYFQKQNAALVLHERGLTAPRLVSAIHEVLTTASLKENLARNISSLMPAGGAEAVAGVVSEIARLNPTPRP